MTSRFTSRSTPDGTVRFTSSAHMRAHGSATRWPIVLQDRAAVLAALLAQFEETPTMSAAQLTLAQHAQLGALAQHAFDRSPYFADRLRQAGLTPSDLAQPGALGALPVLTRQALQANETRMYADAVPGAHLPLSETSTSGSTGRPVTVRRTALNQLFWDAFTIREHLAHQRDVRGTLAVIRSGIPQEGIHMPNWGNPLALLYETGPAHALSSSQPIPDQAAWLTRIDPHYLLTYPSNLSALLDFFEAAGTPLPSLRQVRTVGETVTPALRARVKTIFNVDIADTYSSQELGTIAIQASGSDLYHVMAESYIVEVVDGSGALCGPGETGRIVVTDLHNYATPLVRYATGDFAQTALSEGPFDGLPVLQRVMGRQRNMVLINGTLRWPTLDAHRYREVAPVKQYQLVQTAHDLIEVRLVCAALSADQETAITAMIHEGLHHPMPLRFAYYDAALPRSDSGKFEEFMNLVT